MTEDVPCGHGLVQEVRIDAISTVLQHIQVMKMVTQE